MNNREESEGDVPPSGRYDRRDFMKRALAAELAVLGVGGSIEAAVARAATKAPRRGGTIRVGAPSNGTSETYNPGLANAPIDAQRVFAVFDPLVRIGPRFNHEPGLAIEWVPNHDGTVWEIHLRKGVHWHDGKPFTAEDVIYTFRWRAHPGNFGRDSVAQIRLHDLKKLGNYIVRVPLTRPLTRLSDYMMDNLSSIVVQNGATDFTKPVGTGPFIPQSFTPGQQSVATRNPNYWDHGKPYLDEFQLNSLTDPVAGVNALQAGQLDAVYPVPFPTARAHQSSPGGYLLNLQIGGFAQTIYMRVDQAPLTIRGCVWR